VTFSGRWHTIPDAGLNPLPVQRPIPLWFGGRAEAALRRIARLADGFMLNYRTFAEARPEVERFYGYLSEAGRSREEVGIEVRVLYGDGNPDAWAAALRDWQFIGATHVSLNTMGHGFATPAAHLAALRAFAQAVPLS
jgi:alkanesulfonate monooxygenase SsuD/methylene tetrahydromethanopterin reductase-like flavin-dependent oxidoreductase (luciferase family)